LLVIRFRTCWLSAPVGRILQEPGKDARVNIQYVGFNVAAASRTYTFRVVDAAVEARQFTVKIQSEAFRSTALKFQDGPEICFSRLKRELEGGNQESRAAKPHLHIGDQDIQEYLQRRRPRKRS